MKQKTSVCCVLLVAISISATATAAPQKRERPHQPSLVEVIEHKVMAVVAVVEGAIARGGQARNGSKSTGRNGNKSEGRNGSKSKGRNGSKSKGRNGKTKRINRRASLSLQQRPPSSP